MEGGREEGGERKGGREIGRKVGMKRWEGGRVGRELERKGRNVREGGS